eukprot:2530138-Pyramimonas_sp.AAC.1
MGHRDEQLDVSVLRAVLSSVEPTKRQRGTLLAFVTQSIWTMERAFSAGSDAPQGCPCGHKDDLRHRLLECPKTAPATEESTNGELRRLKDPVPATSPLHLGFQFTPNFVGNPPAGAGLGAAKLCVETLI